MSAVGKKHPLPHVGPLSVNNSAVMEALLAYRNKAKQGDTMLSGIPNNAKQEEVCGISNKGKQGNTILCGIPTKQKKMQCCVDLPNNAKQGDTMS